MTDLDRYLADNPAMTARDWKGKAFTKHSPFDKHFAFLGELPWDELDPEEVRRLATSDKARFLPRSYRMAAARDPGLIWDERSRSYRLRAEATPAPQEASGERSKGEGGQEVSVKPPPKPAAASGKTANQHSGPGTRAGAPGAREEVGNDGQR